MIVKSYRDDQFEIVMQQSEKTSQYSVSLIKNNKEVEFQGKLDYDSASEIFDFYFDRLMGYDMSSWQGAIE